MSDELWDAVKARQQGIRASEGVTKARETRFWERRRARHLLTGLVYCGSRMASVGRDYLACSAARGQGTCSHRGSIRRAPLEELILGGLRHGLMAPEMAEKFIADYHEEVNRGRREATAARAGKERELADVRRKLDKLIDAIAEGIRAPGLQQRLDDLEGRKAALEAALAAPTRRRRCGCTPTSPRSTGTRSSACMRRSRTRRSGTRRSRSCAG